jgi:putative RecB family exonuclease
MADSSRNSSVFHLPVATGDADSGYYSHSHLARFAQCPRSYQMHYVDRLAADIAPERHFGAVLHQVLEETVRDHVQRRQNGPLDADYAAESYRLAWAESELREHALFAEGLDLVSRWVEREGDVRSALVLGTELPFSLHLGPDVALRGVMDRVDRIGDDTIRIRDYKSTRLPPRRDDVEGSLQLAIYDLAARQLWPWAKRVKVAFDLLRHDVVLHTERTAAQREATRRYVFATVVQIRRGEASARPSALCATCDHRAQCDAFAALSAGQRAHAGASLEDLPAVAREREELAAVIKGATVRKDDLDAVLRAALERQPELVLNGRRYTLNVALYREYPLEATVAILAKAGVPCDEATARLATVDVNALRRVVRELRTRMPMPEAIALEDRLDAAARISPVTRLDVRPVREARR